MNAIPQSHQELLREYRMALGVWSEARALYSSDAPEVAAASEHLETLEGELALTADPETVAA